MRHFKVLTAKSEEYSQLIRLPDLPFDDHEREAALYCGLHRSAVADHNLQLAQRGVLRNLKRDALDIFAAVFSARESLNLDLLAAPDFGATGPEPFQLARVARIF